MIHGPLCEIEQNSLTFLGLCLLGHGCVDEEIKDIFQRLLDKGYTPKEILEAFEECLKNGV